MNKRSIMVGRIEGNALGFWYLEEDSTPSIMFSSVDKCTEARDAYFKDLEDNTDVVTIQKINEQFRHMNKENLL